MLSRFTVIVPVFGEFTPRSQYLRKRIKPAKPSYMRTLYRAAITLSALFLVLFSVGCDPDSGGTGGGGGVTLGPEIRLNTGDGLISFNDELPLDTDVFVVNVTGNDGDNPLQNLTIQEDGITIPASRLAFRTGQTANNPILLVGADAGGFTYEIEITPGDVSAGDVTYDFRLTDTDGRVANTNVIITYTSNPPLTELLVADGLVSGDVTITSASTAFEVQVQLTAGDDSIRTLTVLEDGNVLDASQLTFVNPSFDAMNPLVLLPEEQTSSAFRIRISPQGAENTTRTYTFRSTDANGVQGETSVTVTFETPATDLTFTMSGAFFNASGSGRGGLDLDTGESVSFNSSAAEIEDEGINLNATPGTENWRAQVSATNDAVLRNANLSVLGDGVTFDDVLLTSQIAQAFDEGTMPSGSDDFPDADGDTSSNETVTTQLTPGTVLSVRRGDRTYLVRIDDVVYVAGSNNDSYMVSIKY